MNTYRYCLAFVSHCQLFICCTLSPPSPPFSPSLSPPPSSSLSFPSSLFPPLLFLFPPTPPSSLSPPSHLHTALSQSICNILFPPPSPPSPLPLPSRLDTQCDDFKLLAERVKKQQRRTSPEDGFFFSSAGSLPHHLLRPSVSSGGLQASLPTRSTVRATSRSPRLSIRYIQTAFLTASLVHRLHQAHVRGLGLGTRLPNFMALSE